MAVHCKVETHPQTMKPTWNIDCTYDAEAAAELGSTITIEDSGIDKNKKYTVRITAQSIPHQVPSSRCGSPRVSMMSQAHGVKAAALPLQVHHRSGKDRAQPNSVIKIISDKPTPPSPLRTLASA